MIKTQYWLYGPPQKTLILCQFTILFDRICFSKLPHCHLSARAQLFRTSLPEQDPDA